MVLVDVVALLTFFTTIRKAYEGLAEEADVAAFVELFCVDERGGRQSGQLWGVWLEVGGYIVYLVAGLGFTGTAFAHSLLFCLERLSGTERCGVWAGGGERSWRIDLSTLPAVAVSETLSSETVLDE